MSSESSLRLFGLLLWLGVVATGCGHKAPPIPPPLENPARSTDLTVRQRGQAAVLSFTYPHITVSGGSLEKLERIELWRAKKAMSQFLGDDAATSENDEPDTQNGTENQDSPDVSELEEAPPDSSGDGETETTEPGGIESESDVPQQPLEVLAAPDPAEFNATAQLVDTLDGDEIEQATEGAKLIFRFGLGDAGSEEWAHTFAIKTFASEKLASAFSNLVTLVQRQPPPPPTDFQLDADADGIRLTWAELAESQDKPIAILVYRRPAQTRIYAEAMARLAGDATEYQDRSATLGERYIYAVTSVGHENPTVESFFGGEREIDYADRFAPAPPDNLIALAEAGRVRLLWDASSEDDVIGYIVLRQGPEEPFRELTEEPILDVEYSDRTVEAGATYEYRILALDRVGNRGEPTDTVVARVP